MDYQCPLLRLFACSESLGLCLSLPWSPYCCFESLIAPPRHPTATDELVFAPRPDCIDYERPLLSLFACSGEPGPMSVIAVVATGLPHRRHGGDLNDYFDWLSDDFFLYPSFRMVGQCERLGFHRCSSSPVGGFFVVDSWPSCRLLGVSVCASVCSSQFASGCTNHLPTCLTPMHDVGLQLGCLKTRESPTPRAKPLPLESCTCATQHAMPRCVLFQGSADLAALTWDIALIQEARVGPCCLIMGLFGELDVS